MRTAACSTAFRWACRPGTGSAWWAAMERASPRCWRCWPGRAQPDTGRVAMTTGLRLGYLPQSDELAGTVGEIVFGSAGGAVPTPWEADPRVRTIVTELLPGISLGRCGAEAVRRRTAPGRARLAAGRRARRAAARRAHQPPGHRGDRLARQASARPGLRGHRGQPRPLAAGHGVRADLGGRPGPGAFRRGRLLGLRARAGRAGARRGGRRTPPPEPGPQGARLAAARGQGQEHQGEVPGRGGHRADRGGAAAPRQRRADQAGDRPAGQDRGGAGGRLGIGRRRRPDASAA